jgi:hypothetical protein
MDGAGKKTFRRDNKWLLCSGRSSNTWPRLTSPPAPFKNMSITSALGGEFIRELHSDSSLRKKPDRVLSAIIEFVACCILCSRGQEMRIVLTIVFASLCAPAWAAMPAAQQNALVKQYCAVCHTDSAMNGGLSLQHYDAAKPDPQLAAMILSKLNAGAMGAAGNGVPDKAAQEAWLASTREQASGATEWFVNRENGVVSASMVREVPSRRANDPTRPLYRISISCSSASSAGEMQLMWSPQPQTGRAMTASVDGKAPVEYRIDGRESMGNGATVQAGHASVLLSTGRKLAFPDQSLTVRDLFDGETVEFPLRDLDRKTRTELRGCFQ